MILIGFAKKIKFLAITKVRPNLTSSSAKKYKGFSKFIKGKIFGHVFNFFKFVNNLLAKIVWTGAIAEVQTVV